MLRRLAVLVPLLIAMTFASAVPAGATSPFCTTIKAQPVTPANDLSTSATDVAYYTHLASWAMLASSKAPTSSLRSDYSRVSKASSSTAKYLSAARNASGFAAIVQKSYDMVHAGADVVIINAQLALTRHAVSAVCRH